MEIFVVLFTHFSPRVPTQPGSCPWTLPLLFRVEALPSCRCESLGKHAWRYSLLPNDAFMTPPPYPHHHTGLPALLPSDIWLYNPSLIFFLPTKAPLHQLYTYLYPFFSISNLAFQASLPLSFARLLCHLPPPYPTPFFSSLSGTITPSVVGAKREQMLELLPTQCTKPPTAGLWILSLLLLYSHKEHRAATPAPALASTSHLKEEGVDRFTYASQSAVSLRKNQEW